MMGGASSRRGLWLDPRTKILLLLFCILSAMMAPSLFYELGLVVLIGLLGVCFGKWKYAWKGVLFYALIVLLTLWIMDTMTGTWRTMFIAFLGLFHKGDHVITTVCEHNSVLRPLYRLQEEGVEVSFLSADENGVLEYEKLPELVRENTKGIVITHASNLTGNITDLERIREVTESRDLLLVVDGSQTAGILPVDVQKQGIDIFCFTGHKGLLGPQGTGGLYVRPGVEICPLKVGGSGIHSFDREHPKAMPEHLEAGTMNVHGIAGLGGALDYLKKKGTKEILQRERQLLRRLEEQIREIPGIRLYGDPDGNRRVGILSFNIGEEDSAYVADWLYEEHGIAVRAGAHCAPLMHQTLGTKEQGAVRISVSHWNTEKEVDRTAEALWELSGI